MEQKPAYNFAYQLDEKYRKEVKVEQKKAKLNELWKMLDRTWMLLNLNDQLNYSSAK